MNLLKEATKEIQAAVIKIFGETDVPAVTFSDRPELSDLQSNICFSLAKKLKISPLVAAEKIAQNMNGDFEVFATAPGFLNLKIKDEKVSDIFSFISKIGPMPRKNKKILIDYGGANIAKPLHVGHLRSAVIGESVKRIADFCGYDVISDAHLGDWGLQMGLTIAGLEEEFDLSYYFGSSSAPPELSMEIFNTVYPKASARAATDENFKAKAQKITVKLQHEEPGYFELWQEIRRISVEEIIKEYSRLNISFDLYRGESDARSAVAETISIFEKKGLVKPSEGAEIVEVKEEGDKEPMPPLMLRSGTGAQLYATTDLATILQRIREFAPEEIWYLTDNRQSLHFKQCFRAAALAGIVSEKPLLYHVPFGTMNGVDGKPFKTRAGGTMSLNDLVENLKCAASKKMEEGKTSGDEELALQIGISALKFGDLINFRSKDYIFDPDKFSSFEGKTGPYILYTAVRIKSILNKAGEFQETFKIRSKQEKDVVISAYKLFDSIFRSFEEKAPSYVASALYDLASSYSTLYSGVKILAENDNVRRAELLTLSKTVEKMLCIGAYLLGMDIPNKM